MKNSFNNIILIIIGLLASLITIFVFVSGESSIKDIIEKNEGKVVNLQNNDTIESDSSFEKKESSKSPKRDGTDLITENDIRVSYKNVSLLGNNFTSKIFLHKGAETITVLKTSFGEDTKILSVDLSPNKERICFGWYSGHSGSIGIYGFGIVNIDSSKNMAYNALKGQVVDNVIWTDDNRISFLIEKQSYGDDKKEIAGYNYSKYGSVSAYVNKNNIVTSVKSF